MAPTGAGDIEVEKAVTTRTDRLTSLECRECGREQSALDGCQTAAKPLPNRC